MDLTTYNVNHAFNLARSEVFFEMSVARVQLCLKCADEQQKSKHVTVAIYFLQSALEHALLASKSKNANPLEKPFVRFIQLTLCYLRSARELMENEKELKDRNSQLWQFLSRKAKDDEPQKFSRSSEQLLSDVTHLFAMADEPFRDLHRTMLEQMDESNRARHQAAQEAMRDLYSDIDRHCLNPSTYSRPNFLFNS